METMPRRCPVCDQVLSDGDGFFTCDEHGKWYSYSADLLVRAPEPEAPAAVRVLMPWEQLLPAV